MITAGKLIAQFISTLLVNSLFLKMAPTEESSVKLVVIGDAAVGKTCVLVSYTQNAFSQDYVPTVFDNYAAQVNRTIDGIQRRVNLNFSDTAGQEEYDRIRPVSYPNTDILLIVYAVNSPDSFDNVKAKWIGEANQHCPGKRVILVGNKTDLRTDETTVKELAAKKQKPVSYKEGVAMAKMIGAKKYIECSAKTQHNLKEVFDEVLQEYFKGEVKTNKSFGDQSGIGMNSIG